MLARYSLRLRSEGWSVISEQDHIIPAPLQMHFAQQMRSTVVPLATGHLAMVQEPQAVANAIIAAANGY